MSGPTRTPARQHGSAAVTIMLILVGLIAILGLVEVGYIYWAKRDVQKVADLAALAGAQQLETCRSDLGDNNAARQNAVADNRFGGTLEIRCGHWSPGTGTDAVIAPGADRPVNAVQVDARRSAIPLFGQISNLPTLHARAIARSSEPVAAFSIGSRLLDVTSNGPVQGLLRMIGVDLSNTEVASFRGLAQVKVTPRGLLQALGIPVAADISAGDLNNLLNAQQVSVGQLLDVMAGVGQQQGVADVDVGLLRSRLASLGIDNLLLRLGSANGSSGLFANIAAGASASSALDADINALNLVTTSLQIANGRNAVAIPSLNVLGLVQGKVSVVEPPSIAIGPVGTTAYNSQVRLSLDIDSDQIPVLSAALKLLGTRIKLPIYIDVVDGFGRLSRIDCSSQPRQATVDVTSSVSNICIGRATVPWNSTRELCTSGVENENLVTLLGKNVLTHKIVLDALSAQDSLTLSAGQSGTVAPNPLALGDLTANLVDRLLGTLEALLSPGGNPSDNAKELATRYLEATKHPHGYYQPALVIDALRNGHGELAPLGSWTTSIPGCRWALLVCIPEPVQGEVWEGFRIESGISDSSVVGGLLDVLGITSCSGLITGILAYNPCVRNSLAKYLETKPGGLQGVGNYNPVSGTGTCSGVLCTLLRPLINGVLRPLLNGVGNLLSALLSNVLGINLGRSVVDMHAIQCGGSDLVH